MTIMCVATDGSVPSVRPCRIKGDHRVTCTNPECDGCLPRPAERGFLCARHYDDVEHAYMRWDDWRTKIRLVGDRAVKRDTDGRGSSSAGYIPLSGVALAVDECDRFIASLEAMPRPSLQVWVSTDAGARDAIQFARAAESAYRAHEVMERPHKIPTVRCPFCALKTLIWLPPVYFRSEVTITCTNESCGRDLTQQAFEAIAEIEESSRKRA